MTRCTHYQCAGHHTHSLFVVVHSSVIYRAGVDAGMARFGVRSRLSLKRLTYAPVFALRDMGSAADGLLSLHYEPWGQLGRHLFVPHGPGLRANPQLRCLFSFALAPSGQVNGVPYFHGKVLTGDVQQLTHLLAICRRIASEVTVVEAFDSGSLSGWATNTPSSALESPVHPQHHALAAGLGLAMIGPHTTRGDTVVCFMSQHRTCFGFGVGHSEAVRAVAAMFCLGVTLSLLSPPLLSAPLCSSISRFCEDHCCASGL